jgi:hypothetical protein
VTRDERETECYKWLFVVAAGVSWTGSVGVRSEFGGVSHKSAIRSPVINETVRQPGQAFNYKLQSERSHGFLQQPKAPRRFQTDPGSNPVAAPARDLIWRLVHH